ncbi:MAG: methionyl-tRNA formyltransferase [Patescibacteria group bacterium]
MNIIFFGSTTDSVLVLDKLIAYRLSLIALRIAAVVTQPPRPVGRKQMMTPTPVERWAKEKNIPVLSFHHNKEKPWLFADETQVIDSLQPFKADLLISACFGQKIPMQAIQAAPLGGLNVHPSLLPRWRGADPVPWAILSGDHQTGASVVTLSEKFDEGTIIAQKKIPITDKDFSDPLRTKLFAIGADLLVQTLSNPNAFKGATFKGHITDEPYARRFTRDDGFESWQTIQNAMNNPEEAARIDRKFHALHPWPGLWTKVSVRQSVKASKQKKRLKIILLHRRISGTDAMTPYLILDTVQLEGKKPVRFQQFAS